jgi:hypothetical protein
LQGRIQDFKLGGGAHLKKLRRAEGGAKIFGIFRVKNHDFTPKIHSAPPPLDPPLSWSPALRIQTQMFFISYIFRTKSPGQTQYYIKLQKLKRKGTTFYSHRISMGLDMYNNYFEPCEPLPIPSPLCRMASKKNYIHNNLDILLN